MTSKKFFKNIIWSFIALIKLVKTEHIVNAKNENIRDIELLIEVIVPKTFESTFF